MQRKTIVNFFIKQCQLRKCMEMFYSYYEVRRGVDLLSGLKESDQTSRREADESKDDPDLLPEEGGEQIRRPQEEEEHQTGPVLALRSGGGDQDHPG
jgi:hypothetical protein